MSSPSAAARALHAAHGGAFPAADGWPEAYGTGPASSVAEHAAARGAAGVVDLSDREVLVVGGPTRLKFLHGLLSHEIANLAEGDGRPAAIMDVKGHLIALLRVLALRDSVWLELPAGRADVVERWLTHYRVAAPVRFARRPGAVFGLMGPGGPDALRALGADPPGRPESHVGASLAGADARIVRAGDLPAAGYVIHVGPEHHGSTWEALVRAGAVPVGRRALDTLRVEDGRPWFGPDVSPANLLHETGLLREYHSASKGCYVGQEVVARLEGRGGHVNKALRGLRLSAPGSPGDRVVLEGDAVGELTTTGESPELGPVALGWIQRRAFEPGTRVQVGGAEACVERLPLLGAGNPAVAEAR